MTAPTPLLLLLLAVVVVTRGELSTDPSQLAVEPEDVAELTCTWGGDDNSTKLASLRWSRLHTVTGATAGTPVETGVGNSSRVTAANGVLTIHNVTSADAGEYRCRDDAGSEPAQSKLIVYDMPSYAREGAIIAGIAAALLAVIAVGLVINARRQRTLRRRKEEAGPSKPYTSLVEDRQA